EHRRSRRTQCTRLLGNFEKNNLVEAMRVLRCTRRALDYLGAAAGDQSEPGDVDGVLKEWYVNLLRIERRNCLLFAEARTLYVFLVPGVVKRDVEKLPALFAERL